MHHETGYLFRIDGSRHALRDACSGGPALPIVMSKFSVAGPGRAPSPRVGVAIADIKQAVSDVRRKGRDRARQQQIYSNAGRRTTTLHPTLVFWDKNEKSHPRSEKTPNGINAAAINLSLRLTSRNERRITSVESRHSGVIGCVTTFSLSTRKIKRLCLNAARLVNAMPAPFLCTEQHK
jgi:hypothetical protein